MEFVIKVKSGRTALLSGTLDSADEYFFDAAVAATASANNVCVPIYFMK